MHSEKSYNYSIADFNIGISFSKDGINMISTRVLLQWRACSMMLTK